MIRDRLGEAAIAFALAAAAVAIHLFYWDRGFILLDEGFVATTASVMARGGHLYRDAVSYALPGGYALLALVFSIFGESLRVSRGLALALLALLVLACWRIARTAMSRRAAALAVTLVVLLTAWSFPQWQVYGYQQPGLVAVLLAAALLAPADAAGRLLRPALAGLLLGFATCTKQTYAVAAGALALFLLADRALAGRRGDPRPWHSGPVAAPVLTLAACAALPVLLTIAGALRAGTLGDLWTQSVLSPLHGADFDGYVGLPEFRDLFSQDPVLRAHLVHYMPPLLDVHRGLLLTSRLWRLTSVPDFLLKLLYLKPILVMGLGLLVLAWRLRSGWAAARGGALLWALDAGVLAGANRPFDWMHESYAWVGTLLLGTWILLPGKSPRRGLLRALAVFTALVAAVTAWFVFSLRAANDTPVRLPRAGVFARPADARALERIVEAIERTTPADEPIAVVPYQPLVQFLSGRPPASRFLLVWPVEYQSGRDAEMLADVDRRGVRTIVYGATAAPQLGTIARSAPELLSGLAERFRVAEVVVEDPHGISFLRLERRPAEPQATRQVELPPDVTVSTWPFEKVISPALRPGGASEIRIPLPEGPPGEVVLGWGANPDRWIADRPLPVVFSARIESGGGTREVLHDQREPRFRLADRAWGKARIPFDGRAATLVLTIATADDGPAGDGLAGWTLPRIEPATSPPGKPPTDHARDEMTAPRPTPGPGPAPGGSDGKMPRAQPVAL
ncbi:MAG: glycosyltransferase family 39 protein, partial [Alphaproteobacteria bacterium]